MVLIVGKIVVPVAGTPVQVSATAEYQAALVAAGLSGQFKAVQAILFQSWKGNGGQVYIGTAAMNKTTGAGVGCVLVIPSVTSIPSFGAANQAMLAGIDVSALYIDVDTNGEGVLVTLLVS
jgi:hypothetical protein